MEGRYGIQRIDGMGKENRGMNGIKGIKKIYRLRQNKNIRWIQKSTADEGIQNRTWAEGQNLENALESVKRM